MGKEQQPITKERIISPADFISEATFFERAAKLKKLKLGQNDEEFCFSRPVAKLPLDEGFKKSLIDHGFKIDNTRPDSILTISLHQKADENYPIKASDYWNIKKSEKPIFVLPQIDFSISPKERSILLEPHITFSDVIVGAVDQNVHNRITEVIGSYCQKTPPILKEIVQNNFKLVVPWKEIDAAGSRTLYELFNEWAGGNETIKNLAFHRDSIFKPSPHNYDYDEIRYAYLPEQLQGNLFAQWKKQLEKFKSKLG